jgi:hypothetical protein
MDGSNRLKNVLKGAVFPALEYLTVPQVMAVLPTSFHGSYIRWLARREKYDTAIEFHVAQIRSRSIMGLSRLAQDVNPSGHLVLIIGPPKVGKSTLARALADRMRFDLVYTDPIRPLYERIECVELRNEIREQLLSTLVSGRRGGLILEGVALLEETDHAGLCLSMACRLAKRHGARIYACGASDMDPVAKRKSIRATAASVDFDCWTNNLTDREIDSLAVGIIDTSRKLKQLATEAGIRYFEIGPAEFESGFESIICEIYQDLSAGEQLV